MAKRKNRAATDVELGLIANIQPDDRMTNHHDQHSNANKAIIDLYEALDIDIDGNTGDIILGTDFGNTVPDATGHAGKVLATDGTDYGWSYVDSDSIVLSNAPGSPFGITDDPDYATATTQAEANALFVRYISENEEAVKELALALGLDLNVDVDGNITIELPGGGDVPSLDDKFDANDAAGDGPSVLTNAKDMEDAIDSNKADIDNLVVNLGGTVNPDGSINIDVDALPDQTGQGGNFLTTDGTDASWADVPEYDDQGVKDDIAQNESDIAQNTADIAQKFNKDVQGGAGPVTYTTALSMENAIDGNASSIGDLNQKVADLTQEIIDGNAEINVDVATKLDRGTTNYADAAAIESAVTTLETNKADVNHDHDLDYATKAELTAEETARIAGDNALDARVSTNEADIAAIDVSNFTTKTYVDTADATKFDKGATSYADAKAMEDAIEANTNSINTINSSGYDDLELRGLISDEETARVAGDQNLQAQIDTIQSSGYDDTQLRADFAAADATTLASANTYTDEEVAKIVVPDVDDFVTETELNTALLGKADEPHTHADLAADDHTHDIADVPHDHDLVYQPLGDYATNDDLTNGLAGKSDTTHVHPPQDLTHDHDAEYQPVGDYATKTELSVVDVKADANTTKNAEQDGKITALEAGQLVQDGKITANETKNTEQDGKIADLESANTSLDNKIEALENALISAKYKVEISTGQAPREGFVRLDDANPSSIALMVFNPKDANGITHDFSGVKDGDKLTIATSSAVGTYNIVSATAGSLSVTTISGNGTFAADDVVDVKVSPEFDASSYATTAYVDAQDATKFNKGATGPTDYTTAELMETAIKANKTAISDNTDAIDAVSDGKVNVGNDVDNDQYACTSIVALTKSDYDGLATKSPTTMYLVVG